MYRVCRKKDRFSLPLSKGNKSLGGLYILSGRGLDISWGIHFLALEDTTYLLATLLLILTDRIFRILETQNPKKSDFYVVEKHDGQTFSSSKIFKRFGTTHARRESHKYSPNSIFWRSWGTISEEHWNKWYISRFADYGLEFREFNRRQIMFFFVRCSLLNLTTMKEWPTFDVCELNLTMAREKKLTRKAVDNPVIWSCYLWTEYFFYFSAVFVFRGNSAKIQRVNFVTFYSLSLFLCLLDLDIFGNDLFGGTAPFDSDFWLHYDAYNEMELRPSQILFFPPLVRFNMVTVLCSCYMCLDLLLYIIICIFELAATAAAAIFQCTSTKHKKFISIFIRLPAWNATENWNLEYVLMHSCMALLRQDSFFRYSCSLAVASSSP